MPHNEPTFWQLVYAAFATIMGWLAWQWKRLHTKIERIDRDHVTRHDLYMLMKDFRDENSSQHRDLHHRLDQLFDKLLK